MMFFLESVGQTPSADIVNPRYSTSFQADEHLLVFKLRSASLNLSKNMSRVS